MVPVSTVACGDEHSLCVFVACPSRCSKCSQVNGVVTCDENRCDMGYARASDGTCQSKTCLELTRQRDTPAFCARLYIFWMFWTLISFWQSFGPVCNPVHCQSGARQHTLYSVIQCIFMAALCNRAGHYIFALWFLSSSILFSSPNLSRRRLDVYHTSTHGVALVWI